MTDDDDNESLSDLTSGESCLSPETETCPTSTINYNLVEPRIKLRLNPPKPKILLRLKQTEQASSQVVELERMVREQRKLLLSTTLQLSLERSVVNEFNF